MPLAEACPLLRQLIVTGQIGSVGALHHFGMCCPALASLEACITDFSNSTLQSLSVLLPNLTSLAASSPSRQLFLSDYWRDVVDSKQTQDTHAIILALKACPRLISLHTGSYLMSKDIWQAMPQSLQTLTCTATRYDLILDANT